jgi:mono/diheme cytochrome c family protein
MHRTLPWFILVCCPLTAAALLATPERVRADGGQLPRVQFNRQIRPLLSDRCFRCHGPDASHREAELRLDTAAGARADLGGRQAIVEGNPEESELFARIASSNDTERMPPPAAGKPLTAAEIALIRRWIAEGAEYQPHWSFIPPTRPPVPPVNETAWPRGAIDQFLLARLEFNRISPAPDADRVTLIRRLSFDLLGLPPRPAEVTAFLQDTDRDAYGKLVERMLESKHFGERMAMVWLDLVRYADTVGYHGDQEHAITPYRDYVIKALNDNLPFDRFTIEQLAGDLLPDATTDQKIASGYNRLLQTSHEGGVQVQEYLHKYDADRIRNLGSVWMGATLGCVECHDHKYDPYTQRDYYSLVAVFADVDDLRTFKGVDGTPVKREPELVVHSPIDRERLERLETKIGQLEERLAAITTAGVAVDGDEAASLRKELVDARLESETLSRQTRRTMVTEAITPKTVRILARGDWMDTTGEIVTPAFPAFLKEAPAVNGRLTRLDLARWLTAPDHPQTSRVFVNRLWALYFGNGLSNSLEDSGSQGEWPSHPALLDWLATEFSGSGWNIKHMVRLIVTSRAYQQSSQPRPELNDRDPHNRLLARQATFRLPAEIVRDNALAVSGLLIDQVGGPSARPYQPAGYYKYLNFPKREYQADADANQYRRGVYMHWQRTYLHPMLKAFDAPSREECTARRPVSNTPLAALTLLNDPSFVEMARVFAVRILREGSADDSRRLRWAWQTALNREPTAGELATLSTLLDESRSSFRAAPESAEKLLSVGLAPRPADLDAVELAAWTAIARALLNLHESITRY